jgi:hypothetical protein
MGYYVHIHVAFNCTENEPVASLAAKWLAQIPNVFEECKEAFWFLTDLSKRTGTNLGPKGGLSLWGMVGNYTRPLEFVEALRPFWEDLLQGSDDLPCSHARVVVLYEIEQSEHASAIEIGWEDENVPNRKLRIRHFPDLPFAWMQF